MPNSAILPLSYLFAYVALEFFLLPTIFGSSSRPRYVRALLSLVTYAALLLLLYGLREPETGFYMVSMSPLLAWAFLKEYVEEGTAIRLITRHLLGLVGLACALISADRSWPCVADFLQRALTPAVLLTSLAFIAATRPSSAVVANIMKPWFHLVSQGAGLSLQSAGTAIGYLERTLIVTFILLGHWDAIGFLLAAKGILRFNDIAREESRPSSEYVILGTLLSFSLAIAIGVSVRAMIG